MPRKENINLTQLRKHDLGHDDEIVRRLEMVVDSEIGSPGHIIQFWNDVQTYSVREAILYVRNGGYGNADAIQAAWDAMKGPVINGTASKEQ